MENADIELVDELCCDERPICLQEFEELALIVLEENGLLFPENHTDAEQLYLELVHALENIEGD